ncbi:MAG: UDP-N-acetylmuramate dehydrogenase [Helicobacteraceae bacterium]|jgi:UDP-N-acetylmuramate dehydrogenase|nr:UDP-N-acetylmuramate dehydrogenase [Helicobacteraceae bacterium]
MFIDFQKYSSIRIGSTIKVETIGDRGFDPSRFFVVGNACNLLVSPNPPPIAILDRSFEYCRVEGGALIAGGKTPIGRLVSLCKKEDFGGLEFLSGLPGSVGGLIAMNAGLKKRSAFDRLLWVDLGRGAIEAKTIEYGYRFAKLDGVVFEAAFMLNKGFDRVLEASFLEIRSKQPKEPSAGSCFKNPDGAYAGALIEATGLRGFRRGGAGFSDKHANFLVNLGGATYDDALWLIDEAKRRVLDRFNIALETEIKILSR